MDYKELQLSGVSRKKTEKSIRYTFPIEKKLEARSSRSPRLSIRGFSTKTSG